MKDNKALLHLTSTYSSVWLENWVFTGRSKDYLLFLDVLSIEFYRHQIHYLNNSKLLSDMSLKPIEPEYNSLVPEKKAIKKVFKEFVPLNKRASISKHGKSAFLECPENTSDDEMMKNVQDPPPLNDQTYGKEAFINQMKLLKYIQCKERYEINKSKIECDFQLGIGLVFKHIHPILLTRILGYLDSFPSEITYQKKFFLLMDLLASKYGRFNQTSVNEIHKEMLQTTNTKGILPMIASLEFNRRELSFISSVDKNGNIMVDTKSERKTENLPEYQLKEILLNNIEGTQHEFLDHLRDKAIKDRSLTYNQIIQEIENYFSRDEKAINELGNFLQYRSKGFDNLSEEKEFQSTPSKDIKSGSLSNPNRYFNSPAITSNDRRMMVTSYSIPSSAQNSAFTSPISKNSSSMNSPSPMEPRTTSNSSKVVFCWNCNQNHHLANCPSMRCDICNISFRTLQERRIHTNQEHFNPHGKRLLFNNQDDSDLGAFSLSTTSRCKR